MAFARYNLSITDLLGNVVNGAQVLVQREAPGQLAPQLYDDYEGAVPKFNPFIATDGRDGGFHVAGGRYKITITFGATTIIWRNVSVGTANAYDVESLSGAFTQSISIQPDAFVALIANRATYNAAAAGFAVVVASDSTNNDLPTLYFKNSATSGDWSIGITWAPASDGAAKVRLVAKTNVNIATGLQAGQVIDGVTLVAGNKVLLTAQTTTSQNGLYTVVSAGAASRSGGFTSYDQIAGSIFFVMEGSSEPDTVWRCSSNFGGTIGVTALVIAKLPIGGDVVGPASSVNGRIALFDLATGKLLRMHTLGAGDMTDYNLADQGTAEGGLSNATGMSPLRTKQAIHALQSMEPILSQTVASVATCDFTTSNSPAAWNGTYKRLVLVLSNIHVGTDDVELWLRTFSGGVIQTGNYSWCQALTVPGTGIQGPSSASDTKLNLTGNGAGQAIGNVAGENFNGTVTIDSPNLSQHVNMHVNSAYSGANGNAFTCAGGGFSGNGPCDGLRVLTESGTFSGTLTLYGERTA